MIDGMLNRPLYFYQKDIIDLTFSSIESITSDDPPKAWYFIWLIDQELDSFMG